MKNNFCAVRPVWLEQIEGKHAYAQACVRFAAALTAEIIVAHVFTHWGRA